MVFIRCHPLGFSRMLAASALMCGMGSVLSGCGAGTSKSSDDDTNRQEQKQSATTPIRIGDRARLRIVRTQSGTRPYRTEELNEIIDWSKDRTEIFVRHTEIGVTRQVDQRWFLADDVVHFGSADDLQDFCVARAGAIESIAESENLTFQACHFREERSYYGLKGVSQVWYGLVPFGTIRESWKSADGKIERAADLMSYAQSDENVSVD